MENCSILICYLLDKALLPDKIQPPLIVSDSEKMFLCEQKFDEITDGQWLVLVEGKINIRTITRIPIARVKVSDKNSFFESNIQDIKAIAKCKFSLMEYL